MAAPKKIDYDRIEPDWRAGVKSVPQLAADYLTATGVKVSAPAITKYFKSNGVPRDLSGKIQAKANAIVLGKVSGDSKVSDETIIEANAVMLADIRINQRSTIKRYGALSEQLLAELEGVTGTQDLLAELGEFIRGEDSGSEDKRNELYRKVLALPSRIDSQKKLVDTLKVLHDLETKAYGLDQPGGEENADLCTMNRATLEAIARRG